MPALSANIIAHRGHGPLLRYLMAVTQSVPSGINGNYGFGTLFLA